MVLATACNKILSCCSAEKTCCCFFVAHHPEFQPFHPLITTCDGEDRHASPDLKSSLRIYSLPQLTARYFISLHNFYSLSFIFSTQISVSNATDVKDSQTAIRNGYQHPATNLYIIVKRFEEYLHYSLYKEIESTA